MGLRGDQVWVGFIDSELELQWERTFGDVGDANANLQNAVSGLSSGGNLYVSMTFINPEPVDDNHPVQGLLARIDLNSGDFVWDEDAIFQVDSEDPGSIRNQVSCRHGVAFAGPVLVAVCTNDSPSEPYLFSTTIAGGTVNRSEPPVPGEDLSVFSAGPHTVFVDDETFIVLDEDFNETRRLTVPGFVGVPIFGPALGGVVQTSGSRFALLADGVTNATRSAFVFDAADGAEEWSESFAEPVRPVAVATDPASSSALVASVFIGEPGEPNTPVDDRVTEIQIAKFDMSTDTPVWQSSIPYEPERSGEPEVLPSVDITFTESGPLISYSAEPTYAVDFLDPVSGRTRISRLVP